MALRALYEDAMKTFTQWIIEGRSFEYGGKKYSSGFGRYTCDGESISREEYMRVSDAYKNNDTSEVTHTNKTTKSNKVEKKKTVTSLKPILPEDAIPDDVLDDYNTDEDDWIAFLKDREKSLKLRTYLSEITGFDLVDKEDFHKWCLREGDKIGEGGKNLVDTVRINRWRERVLEKRLEEEGIDAKDFKETLNKALKDYIESAEICVRCNRLALSSILDDGRFKSQFETKTSKGYLNYSVRANVEAAGQGLKYNTKKKDRPIYGTLKHKDDDGIVDLEAYNTDYSYGDFCVVLKKDSVRKKTMVTIGDSLVEKLVSTQMDDPNYVSMLSYVTEGSEIKDFYQELKEDGAWAIHNHIGSRCVSYPEAQISGGVSVDDIDYIIYQGYRTTVPERVINKIKKQGLKYVFKEEY